MNTTSPTSNERWVRTLRKSAREHGLRLEHHNGGLWLTRFGSDIEVSIRTHPTHQRPWWFLRDEDTWEPVAALSGHLKLAEAASEKITERGRRNRTRLVSPSGMPA